jgi:hypothetical protein
MNEAIQAEMPRYKCHKEVWALKILSTSGGPDIPTKLHFEGFAPISISNAWATQHKPESGGYYVVYEDGYKSYSPAAAFEAGYAQIGAKQARSEAAIAAVSTAPRITPDALAANIVSEHYFVAGDGVYGAARKAGDDEVQAFPASLDLLTFCVLVLANGFTVTGESACASPENFDAAIGRKIARENAVQKVWPLMGYQLKEQLYQRTIPGQAPEVAA